jgi:hypothetical protein
MNLNTTRVLNRSKVFDNTLIYCGDVKDMIGYKKLYLFVRNSNRKKYCLLSIHYTIRHISATSLIPMQVQKHQPDVKNVSIIISSSLQSTAGHGPLQLLAISLDLWLLTSSSCQPSCANRHFTWPESILHYVYRDEISTLKLVYPNGCRF